MRVLKRRSLTLSRAARSDSRRKKGVAAPVRGRSKDGWSGLTVARTERGGIGRLSVRSGREVCVMDVAITQECHEAQLASNDSSNKFPMPVLPSRTQASVG